MRGHDWGSGVRPSAEQTVVNSRPPKVHSVSRRLTTDTASRRHYPTCGFPDQECPATHQPSPLVRFRRPGASCAGVGGMAVVGPPSRRIATTPELTRYPHVSEYATCITGNDPSGAGG
jgi:hypothetical protein